MPEPGHPPYAERSAPAGAAEAYAGGDTRGRRRAWSAANPGNLAARRELIEAALECAEDQLSSGAAVLDVGCGTGWCLAGLAAAGAGPQTLHGVDLDAARVEAARARVAGALIEVGDARSLPYAAHTFGVVLLVVVLSSLQGAPDAVTALREARRVLAPGGVLLVYEPRLPNPLNFRTRVVRDRDLDMAGLVPRTEQSLTLLPQLGRRLGRLTPVLHPTLSRVPALRSHRLVAYRAPKYRSPAMVTR